MLKFLRMVRNGVLWLKSRKNAVITGASLAILALATIYGGWFASYNLSLNTDAIVPPYLFEHHTIGDATFLGAHTNLLKFPIFYVQSLLPYNIYTFTIVNIGLNLLTVGLMTLAFWLLFGRRLLPVFCLALASFLASSTLLNFFITSTSIRNIEYPLVLLFMIVLAKVITGSRLTKRVTWSLALSGLAYAAVIASDQFFLYTSVPAILLLIAMLYWRDPKFVPKKNLLVSLGVLAGTIVTSFLLLALLSLGTALHTGGDLRPSFISQADLGLSIVEALFGALKLFGANILSLSVAPSSLIVFVNLLLVGLGVLGLWKILRLAQQKVQKANSVQVALILAAFWFTLTPVVFILSGLVLVWHGDKYEVVVRYLTLLPFLLPVFIAYFVSQLKNKQYVLLALGVPALVLTALLVSHTYLERTHTRTPQSTAVAYIKDIIGTAKSHNADTVITGYWLGGAVRLWSDNSVQYAAVTNCTQPAPAINNKKSMYEVSDASKRTAVIVVERGMDKNNWECKESDITSFYGAPEKKISVPSGNNRNNATIWLYDYDVRTKLSDKAVNALFQ